MHGGATPLIHAQDQITAHTISCLERKKKWYFHKNVFDNASYLIIFEKIEKEKETIILKK